MKSKYGDLKPKERLTKYTKGEEVDRIPVMISGGETMAMNYGINLVDYYFSPELIVEVERNFSRDIHPDNMGIGLGLHGLPEALGAKVKYSPKNVLHIENSSIKSFDELEQLDYVNVKKDGRIPVITEALKILIEEFGNEYDVSTGIGGPITVASGIIGVETLLKGTVKNKEGVHRLMRFATDNILMVCKYFREELGINMGLAEPMAAQNLLSLKQFREFVKPYLTEIATKLTEMQGSAGIHICGNTHDRWNDILETGVSSFSVDNCESLMELKAKCGDKICISGNIPPVDVLRYGTKEAVEASVKDCLIQGGNSPKGFILSPGCQVPIHTPIENLNYLMEMATKYGKGAKMGVIPKGIKEYL